MIATVAQPALASADPTLARAEFFAELEYLELTLTIPRAVAIAQPVARY